MQPESKRIYGIFCQSISLFHISSNFCTGFLPINLSKHYKMIMITISVSMSCSQLCTPEHKNDLETKLDSKLITDK